LFFFEYDQPLIYTGIFRWFRRNKKWTLNEDLLRWHHCPITPPIIFLFNSMDFFIIEYSKTI